MTGRMIASVITTQYFNMLTCLFDFPVNYNNIVIVIGPTISDYHETCHYMYMYCRVRILLPRKRYRRPY